MKTRYWLFPLFLAAVPVLAACGRKIGDECKTNFDCNQSDSTRICDIAQTSGYCTIEGCDERSCPDDSVCVRFFPRKFLNRPCNPMGSEQCQADELCLDSGVCAPRALERRYCVQSCGGNDDCRGGYECRLAGTLGSMSLSKPSASSVHFCAPTSP